MIISLRKFEMIGVEILKRKINGVLAGNWRKNGSFGGRFGMEKKDNYQMK